MNRVLARAAAMRADMRARPCDVCAAPCPMHHGCPQTRGWSAPTTLALNARAARLATAATTWTTTAPSRATSLGPWSVLVAVPRCGCRRLTAVSPNAPIRASLPTPASSPFYTPQ